MLQDALPQAVGVFATYALCFGYFPVCVRLVPTIVADFRHPKHKIILQLIMWRGSIFRIV